MDNEGPLDPDGGQNSPIQSEKLLGESEWEDPDQRSPVAPIDKGKNKAIPQFSTSDDIQMNEPTDSPPWGDDGRDGFNGMECEFFCLPM